MSRFYAIITDTYSGFLKSGIDKRSEAVIKFINDNPTSRELITINHPDIHKSHPTYDKTPFRILFEYYTNIKSGGDVNIDAIKSLISNETVKPDLIINKSQILWAFLNFILSAAHIIDNIKVSTIAEIHVTNRINGIKNVTMKDKINQETNITDFLKNKLLTLIPVFSFVFGLDMLFNIFINIYIYLHEHNIMTGMFTRAFYNMLVDIINNNIINKVGRGKKLVLDDITIYSLLETFCKNYQEPNQLIDMLLENIKSKKIEDTNGIKIITDNGIIDEIRNVLGVTQRATLSEIKRAYIRAQGQLSRSDINEADREYAREYAGASYNYLILKYSELLSEHLNILKTRQPIILTELNQIRCTAYSDSLEHARNATADSHEKAASDAIEKQKTSEWEPKWVEEKQKNYWKNKKTGEKTWTNPTEKTWLKIIDKNSRLYWKNKITDEMRDTEQNGGKTKRVSKNNKRNTIKLNKKRKK